MTKFLLFGSPTCMPCKTVKGILPTLGFEFDYIDVIENPDLASEHLIMSTPTMVKLIDGVAVKTVVGQGAVMQLVDEELNQ